MFLCGKFILLKILVGLVSSNFLVNNNMDKCKKCQLPAKFDRIGTKLSIIDFKSTPFKYEVQVLCDGNVIARVPVDK